MITLAGWYMGLQVVTSRLVYKKIIPGNDYNVLLMVVELTKLGQVGKGRNFTYTNKNVTQKDKLEGRKNLKERN